MGQKIKLIALTGLPRCGKDTFAERLVKKYGFLRLSFAAPLKEASALLLGRELSEMNGEDGFDREAVLPEWGFSTRWFLQVFGTECLRDQVRPDFWVHKMRIQLDSAARSGSAVVITDCRFPNEAAMIREMGGTIVELLRPGCVSTGHVSDSGVNADIRIQNGRGVIELWDAVDDLVSLSPEAKAFLDSREPAGRVA